MSVDLDTIEGCQAYANAEFKAELKPLDPYEQVQTWLQGWRASLTPDDKRFWVHVRLSLAFTACVSGLLAPEEFPLVLHELLFVEAGGPQDLTAEDRNACEEAHERWQYRFFPGCNCVACAPPPSGAPPTPDATPQVTPETVSAVPAAVSSETQPKKRRGRPVGRKDAKPRAPRGSLRDLSKAEQSARSRRSAKERKREEQGELQQQHQPQQPIPVQQELTPPAQLAPAESSSSFLSDEHESEEPEQNPDECFSCGVTHDGVCDFDGIFSLVI